MDAQPDRNKVYQIADLAQILTITIRSRILLDLADATEGLFLESLGGNPVSYHVGTLRSAGLVVTQRVGQESFHEITDRGLKLAEAIRSLANLQVVPVEVR